MQAHLQLGGELLDEDGYGALGVGCCVLEQGVVPALLDAAAAHHKDLQTGAAWSETCRPRRRATCTMLGTLSVEQLPQVLRPKAITGCCSGTQSQGGSHERIWRGLTAAARMPRAPSSWNITLSTLNPLLKQQLSAPSGGRAPPTAGRAPGQHPQQAMHDAPPISSVQSHNYKTLR